MNIIIDFFAQIGDSFREGWSLLIGLISSSISDFETLSGLIPGFTSLLGTFSAYCPSVLVSLSGIVLGIRVIKEVRR